MRRAGIDRADVSKLEKGSRNPGAVLLRHLADGLGKSCKTEFVPKTKFIPKTEVH